MFSPEDRIEFALNSFKMLFFKSVNIENEDLETLIDVMIIIMESSISPGSLYKALPAKVRTFI